MNTTRKPKHSIYKIHDLNARRAHIEKFIKQADGNINYAANLLGIDSANLRRIMRQVGYAGYPGKVKTLCANTAQNSALRPVDG